MNKKFLITIKNTSRRQQKDFVKFLSQGGFGWWKQFDETWIIIAPHDMKTYTASSIRDALQIIFPEKYMLIIDLGFSKINWAAYGTVTDFDWFKDK